MTAVSAAHHNRIYGMLSAMDAAGSTRPARASKAVRYVKRAAAAVGLLVAVVILAITFAPRFFSFETFVVRDAAMAPAIGKSAVVVAQPVRPDDLRAGDVITFRRPEQPDVWLTRRVVEARPVGGTALGAAIIATKADSNLAPDPWRIELHGSAWRLAFTVPLAGYLVAIAQTPWGLTLFLLAPSAGLSLLVLERSWHGLRQEDVA